MLLVVGARSSSSGVVSSYHSTSGFVDDEILCIMGAGLLTRDSSPPGEGSSERAIKIETDFFDLQ